jgi:hypothetical protein
MGVPALRPTPPLIVWMSFRLADNAYAGYLAGPTSITLTMAWQRFKITGTLATGQTGLWIVVRQYDSNGDDWTTGSIYLWPAFRSTSSRPARLTIIPPKPSSYPSGMVPRPCVEPPSPFPISSSISGAVSPPGGKRLCLWRAVDQDGDVLDILVTRRRDKRATKALLSRGLEAPRGATFPTRHGQAAQVYGCAPKGLPVRHPPNRAIRKQPS